MDFDPYRTYIWAAENDTLQSVTPSLAWARSQEIVDSLLSAQPVGDCETCGGGASVFLKPMLRTAPPLLVLEFFPHHTGYRPIFVCPRIEVQVGGVLVSYRVLAVAFHGSNHFTGCFWEPTGRTWCYDGARHRGVPAASEIKWAGGVMQLFNKQPCMLIYIQDS